jgi:Putative 2OG-Fe(II) oxygenase
MIFEIESKSWWSTPTLALQIKDAQRLNSALEAIIIAEEQKFASRAGTPVAGLDSGLTTHWLEYNVLNWAYPEIREFRAYVLSGIREFFRSLVKPAEQQYAIAGISCWANVLRPGQALQIHHHDPAFLSAHYTVKAGRHSTSLNESIDSGHTVYFRPGFVDRSHGGDAALMPSPWDDDWRISVSPSEGRLFFFPSYVRHEVRPFTGEGHRISIAMDVFLKSQRLLMHYGGPRWFVPGSTDLS